MPIRDRSLSKPVRRPNIHIRWRATTVRERTAAGVHCLTIVARMGLTGRSIIK